MPIVPVRRTALAAFAFLACVPGALAAGPPLSLAEAQRLAVERSRQLAAQAYGVSASREMATAAGQLPDPVLSLGLENLPVEGPDRYSTTRDFMTMRRVGVMQELTSRHKRQLRAERFELEAQKGEAEGRALQAAIQRDTAIAWLDAHFAEAMAASVAAQRERALQETEAAESAYRAGKGMQADVFMARGSVAMIDDRAAEIERKRRNARTQLARWSGVEHDRPLAAPPQLGELAGEALAPGALALHPDIEALYGQERVAASEARLATANRRPDWTVELAWSKRGSQFGDMVSLGVSVPLPWDLANRQDREVAAKLAAVSQAEALREEALRRHVAEVDSMHAEWQANRERLSRFAREILPFAAARSQAALAAYRGGASSLADVLAARRGELETSLQVLQLEAETARLWAQLRYLAPEKSQ